jgi:hypothetical protein
VSTIDSSDIHPFKQQSVKQICLVNDGGIQSHHNPGSSGGTGATEKRSAALCQEGGGPIEVREGQGCLRRHGPDITHDVLQASHDTSFEASQRREAAIGELKLQVLHILVA